MKSRKRYTAEFKAQAVSLLETGKPIAEVAQELCINSDLLYSWRRMSQGAQLGSAGVRALAFLHTDVVQNNFKTLRIS